MAEEIIEGVAVSGGLLGWNVIADTRDRLMLFRKILPQCNAHPDARTHELIQLYNDMLARAGARADASTRVRLEDLPQAGDGLVDTATAAGMLGLTSDAIRWHCRTGQFAKVAIKRGRGWWIPVADVEAYARRNDD